MKSKAKRRMTGVAVRIAGAWILACWSGTTTAQGTFSGGAIQGLGTGGTKAEKPIPVLTTSNIEAWLTVHVKDIEMRIRAAKRSALSPNAKSPIQWIPKSKRYQFRTRQDRDTELARLEKELASPTDLPLLCAFALNRGQIGALTPLRTSGLPYRVVQIVDQRTALIRASRGRDDIMFFIVSPSVANMQEGRESDSIPGVFVVEGTRQYTTVTGAASTLPVVTDFDVGAQLEKLRNK